MIIPCPHCQAKLNLPENVEGKEVRCPSCREVFRADKEALQERVQPGLPETTPTSVTPKPRADDAGTPRSRDYEDDDEHRADDWGRRDIDRRGQRDAEETEELVADAKALARPAGYVMLAAFVFTALNIVGNAGLTILTEIEMGALPADANGPLAGMLLCGISIYLIPLILMMLGGRALLTLGSRGVIITAIVMNFIMCFILGAGAAVNVAVLVLGEMPVPSALVLPTVVMNSISSALNLGAGVMAIRVLMFAEVGEVYAMRSERGDLARRRHY